MACGVVVERGGAAVGLDDECGVCAVFELHGQARVESACTAWAPRHQTKPNHHPTVDAPKNLVNPKQNAAIAKKNVDHDVRSHGCTVVYRGVPWWGGRVVEWRKVVGVVGWWKLEGCGGGKVA